MTDRRSLLRTFVGLSVAGWATRGAAAEPGIGKDEILVGQSAVLTGPLGVSVQAFNAGAKLVFDGVNAQGGINGRKLRLHVLDDELKPDRAVANYQALLAEHKVFCFFGGVGSGTIAAATPVLRDSGAPLIGNYALSDSVREKAKGAAYFVRASYAREAEKLVEHLATIGITRVAVAHLANPGGDEVLTLVRAAVKAHGKANDVAGAAGVKNDGSGVAEAAQSLVSANAQAVIMFLSSSSVTKLMQAIWATGSSPAIYGMSIVAGDEVAKVLGKDLRGLATSQVVPYPWSDAEPAAREYRKRSEAAKLNVGYAGYEGYLNGLVLVEALRRAGREPTRAGLHAAMRAMKTRIGGMDLDFTGNSATGSRFVDLAHVTPAGKFRR
ncbi:MAG: ABC transporter substrate-binding protein [Burkholderiales bacterium]|nr:ABC transporter substrate-binding protein [Burkholderiales bacterium]